MTTLYYFSGLHDYLVVGTGNKVEDFGIGFFTKYGDGGVDLSPIADLTKSQVYKLGEELGIIEAIMTAAPTDGLWADKRTDEDQIGASYPELEWAMGFGGDETTLGKRQREVLEIYRKLRNTNQHKLCTCSDMQNSGGLDFALPSEGPAGCGLYLVEETGFRFHRNDATACCGLQPVTIMFASTCSVTYGSFVKYDGCRLRFFLHPHSLFLLYPIQSSPCTSCICGFSLAR